MQFFDMDGNEITPEEARSRYKKMEAEEVQAATAQMGVEAKEELERFANLFIVYNYPQMDLCQATMMMSAAMGDIEGIIQVIGSAMISGGLVYRDLLIQRNPVLADEIDQEIYRKAEELKREVGGDDDTADEAAA